MPLKVTVDVELCQGHSVCIAECPEVFNVVEQDEGYPVVELLLDEPPESLRDKVKTAAQYCPNHVITVDEL